MTCTIGCTGSYVVAIVKTASVPVNGYSWHYAAIPDDIPSATAQTIKDTTGFTPEYQAGKAGAVSHSMEGGVLLSVRYRYNRPLPDQVP